MPWSIIIARARVNNSCHVAWRRYSYSKPLEQPARSTPLFLLQLSRLQTEADQPSTRRYQKRRRRSHLPISVAGPLTVSSPFVKRTRYWVWFALDLSSPRPLKICAFETASTFWREKHVSVQLILYVRELFWQSSRVQLPKIIIAPRFMETSI